MARATWLFAATTIAALAATVWLYFDNRSLRDELARRHDTIAAAPAPAAAARSADPWLEVTRSTGPSRSTAAPAPALPEQKDESRLERRQRRQTEIAALLGRSDGETEDEYRARIVPLIK